MRKTALVMLVGASGAALLLIASGAKSHQAIHPDPYTAASWLAAVLAFAVCIVMLAEYFMHCRQVHLYVGAAFLALAVMGVWNVLTIPSPFFALLNPRDLSFDWSPTWAYLALWQLQWITLAVMLVFGMVISRKLSPREQVAGRAGIMGTAAVLWAALMIFLTSALPAVHRFFMTGRAGMITSIACGVIFAIAFLAYSRAAIHKGNAVLAWMGYGLIFAVLGQIAVAMHEPSELAMELQRQPYGALVQFAGLMKVLVFLFPLAGMLAEHTRVQLKLHEQASELNNLIQTQQVLSSTTSPAEVYQRTVEFVCASFSAAAACLMPFEKERGLLRATAYAGFDDDSAKRLIFRPGEGPPGDSYSKKETVFVRDVLEDPVLVQKVDGESGVRSAVFTPLIVRDESLGALAVFFSGPPVQKMGKEKLRLLEALAAQAALAVDGFQMRGRMLDSARATDGYARELQIVWGIGEAVASKLELDALADAIAEKLKALVAAKSCSIFAFEPDTSGLKLIGRQKLTRRQSVADHTDECDAVAAAAAQKGEPVIANDLPNSSLCKYAETASEDGGTHHLLAVPMSLRGFVGAILLSRQNSEPFGERETSLLTRLSPIVAAGIRNADLYERERNIAESLQKTFVPELSREFAGIQVVSRYQASFDESLIGGDFYDVTDLGDGRYGIVVGDVPGKGLDAAVHTGVTRYMIQTYSADNPDPLHVVSNVNTALCRYTSVGKYVTLVYGVLDTESGTFTYVNAGHEIPFLHKSAGGKLESLESTGPAAGALEEAEYTSEQVLFEAGDMLILYTDGATEVRSEGKFLGTEGLRKIAADHVRRSLADLPDALMTSVRSYAKSYLRDDVLIVVVKAREPGALF